MSNTIQTANMKLQIPVTSVDPGPDFANNINQCLATIDAHNHTSGYGAPIPSGGISVGSDFPFNGNNATTLRAARFSPQIAAIPNATPDVGELYVVGNELYYNDVTGGHQVPITSNGSVTGSSGTITGLPSGTAGAAYNSGSATFVFTSATSTPANIDGGTLTIRNISESANGVSLFAPNALGSSYDITLFSGVPAAQSFVTLGSSGNLATPIAYANGITRGNLAAVGQQVSSSSLSFQTTSGTFVNVTNLSVSITTTGRPVMLIIQPDGTNNPLEIGDLTGGSFLIAFLRNASSVAIFQAANLPSCSYVFLDTPSANTYTYSVQARISVSGTCSVFNAVLMAYEL